MRSCWQVLYAGEPEYTAKTQEMIGLILMELDRTIAALGEMTDAASCRALASAALAFFETTVASTVLSTATIALASKLFGLASKTAQADKAQLRCALAHVNRLAEVHGGAHEKLCSVLNALGTV